MHHSGKKKLDWEKIKCTLERSINTYVSVHFIKSTLQQTNLTSFVYQHQYILLRFNITVSSLNMRWCTINSSWCQSHLMLNQWSLLLHEYIKQHFQNQLEALKLEWCTSLLALAVVQFHSTFGTKTTWQPNAHHLRQIHHPGRWQRRYGAHDLSQRRRALAFRLLPPPTSIHHEGDRHEGQGSNHEEREGSGPHVHEAQGPMVAAATAPRRCGRGSACARLRLRGLRGPPAALGSGGRTPGAAGAAGHRKTLAGNLAVSAGDRWLSRVVTGSWETGGVSIRT